MSRSYNENFAGALWNKKCCTRICNKKFKFPKPYSIIILVFKRIHNTLLTQVRFSLKSRARFLRDLSNDLYSWISRDSPNVFLYFYSILSNISWRYLGRFSNEIAHKNLIFSMWRFQWDYSEIVPLRLLKEISIENLTWEVFLDQFIFFCILYIVLI